MNIEHIRTKDEPAEGWLGPNTPDPEGRDLIDPDYASASARSPVAIACGTREVRGKLVWKWRKI